MTQHRDESGEPCTRHPDLATPRLYELATLGARMPGFHHDAASKLQSLMMALDEIGEIAPFDDPTLRTAIDTATMALRELHQLLNANRALAKPAARVPVAISELVQRAADRVAVSVRGELPACDVRVSVPATTHALAQLFDLLAGTSLHGRAVAVALEQGTQAVLTVTGARDASRSAASTGELLGLATYAIEREEGSLTCADDGARFVVRLPLAG